MTFTERVHNHQEANRYAELRLFAEMHSYVLSGVHDSDVLWAVTAQIEHVFEGGLSRLVTERMLSKTEVAIPYPEALVIATPYYDHTTDLAVSTQANWCKYKDGCSDHEIPSLVFLTTRGGHAAAFSECLDVVKAILQHRDPTSGYWWLISDNIEDAYLARDIARDREQRHRRGLVDSP